MVGLIQQPSEIVFKTGILARLRLWRTLRAARIFSARGQTPEALRAWRHALQIFPGAAEARYGLALDALAAQLSKLENARAQDQDLDKLLSERLSSMAALEERLRRADTAAAIARADWQSTRRQATLRIDNIEQQLAFARAHWNDTEAALLALLRDVQGSNERAISNNDALGGQVRDLSDQVGRMSDHFTALKALSLRVSLHTAQLARQDASMAALGGPTDAAADQFDAGFTERLFSLERALEPTSSRDSRPAPVNRASSE